MRIRKVKRAVLLASIPLIAFMLYYALSPDIPQSVAKSSDSESSRESDFEHPDDGESPELEALFANSAAPEVRESVDLSRERPAVAETRSMYQAHVSLRAPEVDDPDSDPNVRTRGVMLDKMALLAERLEASRQQ